MNHDIPIDTSTYQGKKLQPIIVPTVMLLNQSILDA